MHPCCAEAYLAPCMLIGGLHAATTQCTAFRQVVCLATVLNCSDIRQYDRKLCIGHTAWIFIANIG